MTKIKIILTKKGYIVHKNTKTIYALNSINREMRDKAKQLNYKLI